MYIYLQRYTNIYVYTDIYSHIRREAFYILDACVITTP